MICPGCQDPRPCGCVLEADEIALSASSSGKDAPDYYPKPLFPTPWSNPLHDVVEDFKAWQEKMKTSSIVFHDVSLGDLASGALAAGYLKYDLPSHHFVDTMAQYATSQPHESLKSVAQQHLMAIQSKIELVGGPQGADGKMVTPGYGDFAWVLPGGKTFHYQIKEVDGKKYAIAPDLEVVEFSVSKMVDAEMAHLGQKTIQEWLENDLKKETFGAFKVLGSPVLHTSYDFSANAQKFVLSVLAAVPIASGLTVSAKPKFVFEASVNDSATDMISKLTAAMVKLKSSAQVVSGEIHLAAGAFAQLKATLTEYTKINYLANLPATVFGLPVIVDPSVPDGVIEIHPTKD